MPEPWEPRGRVYREITAKGTSWGTRKTTKEEAGWLFAALSITEGKQNELAMKDITGYCAHVQSLGITDPEAIIFMADIENQSGAGASARIIRTASAKPLDALYASAKSDKVFSSTWLGEMRYIKPLRAFRKEENKWRY